MKIELVDVTPNYMEKLCRIAGVCYQKEVSPPVLEKIIQSGHLSILEHCSATIRMNCSLTVLGQITRHRHLSFTVKSSRGAKFDNCVIPVEIDQMDDYTRQVFWDSIFDSIECYNELILRGVSKESAAYLLPKASETEMFVTGNFRAWFEYLPHRICARALPEHRERANQIQSLLAGAAPEIFHRNLLHCEHCTEQFGCAYGGGKK